MKTVCKQFAKCFCFSFSNGTCRYVLHTKNFFLENFCFLWPRVISEFCWCWCYDDGHWSVISATACTRATSCLTSCTRHKTKRWSVGCKTLILLRRLFVLGLSWFVSATFTETSPRGSCGESRRNGICAVICEQTI